MIETLTIKFPSPLMKNIKERSHRKKMSRGAFVREAITHYISCSSDETDEFDFMKVTQELLTGKKKKREINTPDPIDEIRKFFASQPPPKLSAEEEVRHSRTRGLL